MPLRRHTWKGSFVWDLPDLDRTGRLRAAPYVTNDWQLSSIITAGSPLPYDITYSYQTGGENINLTGSPSYAARTVIVGDPRLGLLVRPMYAQFDTSTFRGPTYGSVGLESGRNYLNGWCMDKTALADAVRERGRRNFADPRWTQISKCGQTCSTCSTRSSSTPARPSFNAERQIAKASGSGRAERGSSTPRIRFRIRVRDCGFRRMLGGSGSLRRWSRTTRTAWSGTQRST